MARRGFNFTNPKPSWSTHTLSGHRTPRVARSLSETWTFFGNNETKLLSTEDEDQQRLWWTRWCSTAQCCPVLDSRFYSTCHSLGQWRWCLETMTRCDCAAAAVQTAPPAHPSPWHRPGRTASRRASRGRPGCWSAGAAVARLDAANDTGRCASTREPTVAGSSEPSTQTNLETCCLLQNTSLITSTDYDQLTSSGVAYRLRVFVLFGIPLSFFIKIITNKTKCKRATEAGSPSASGYAVLGLHSVCWSNFHRCHL